MVDETPSVRNILSKERCSAHILTQKRYNTPIVARILLIVAMVEETPSVRNILDKKRYSTPFS